MKVSKFGGSSVSNATQIKKVLNIVNSDPERKIVIVSAPGKRHDNDIKTTDLLIRLYEKVINHLDYHDKKREIIQRYDVVNDEWIFRLDPNIRIPKSNIYFHSLNWDVDYIKPEIVLMYDLMQHHQYHHYSNYKRVIDALSYYQFFILKFVVGEQRIKDAIQRTINN